jgi:endosialidase-like protein
VAGLVWTLGGTASWGGLPNPTASDAGDNTVGGTDALVNTVPNLIANTGLRNTAFSAQALTSNTDGTNNSALGASALQSNTAGGANTGIGAFTLFLNTEGNNNTGVGLSALFGNTTGANNSAFGAFALGSSTGNSNTAVGASALLNNSAGNRNTAFGTDALHNSTGTNNIAVGAEAGTKLTSGDKNIYLGHKGRASESNTMRLGSAQTRAFIAGITGVPLSGATVTINNNGQLGIVASSTRYKQDIHDMGEHSQGLLKLRPVTFRYKHDPQDHQQYGLIAEEVAQVYPELVTKGADDKVESVQYHELIPMLLNEVQHQQQEIAELKAQAQQVSELKAQNARLEAALALQQAQNAAVATRLEHLEAGAIRAATLVKR